MNIDHFTVTRLARRHIDRVQCLIWAGVPAAWAVLLAAIVYRVIA